MSSHPPDVESGEGHYDTSIILPRGVTSGNDNSNQYNESTGESAGNEIEEAVKMEEEEEADESTPKTRPSLIGSILQLAIMGVLMLTPAALVYFSDGYSLYSFDKVKITSPFTNTWMEYIRWSIFLFMAFASYFVIEWLYISLPPIIVTVLDKSGVPVTGRTKRTIGYLYYARFWFIIFAWLIFLAALGANMLYRTNFLQGLSHGLFAQANNKAKAAAAKISSYRDIWFYLERALLSLAVFFACYGLAKYLIELITVNFHRMVFEERIKESNFRFQVLQEISHAIKEGKKAKLKKNSLTDVQLKRDKHALLINEKSAIDTAQLLFEHLVSPGREFLVKEDFANFVEATDLDDLFSVFDRQSNGDVDRMELREVILDIYEQRKLLARGLLNNNGIIEKLDSLLVGVSIFLTFTFSIPIFQVGGAAVFAIFGILWTALGFLLQSTAKQCFESIVFVFVEHAYDVGDRVVVDGEYLTVERIEIFTTVFSRWDGTAVYQPNANLYSKNIYNIRRSSQMIDFIDFNFAPSTSIGALWNLRDRLAQFASSDPKHYTGKVDISGFSIELDKCKLQLAVEYSSNFQDAAVRASRKNKFVAMVKQNVGELGIEYFP